MVLPTSLYLLLATVSIATQLLDACPTMCKCHKTNAIQHVTCANQSLERISEILSTEERAAHIRGNNSSSYNVFQSNSEFLDLDLGFNRLMNIHMQDFSQLTNLRYLNLQNNSISSIQPKAFSSSPKLVHLNLANNFLESINSGIFVGLQQLEILNLQGNLICNISLNSFLHTDSLISLDLSHNLITDLPSAVFENLHKLGTLNLAYNQLLTVDNVLEHTLTSLQFLDLSRNQIETFSDVSLPSLKDLDLSWNNISSVNDNSFLNISNVLKLTFDGNPVESVATSVFRHMPSLQSLFVSHMPKLHYLSRKTFEGLQNLTMLNLSHNPLLSFIHKDLFITLQSLSYLDLSFNNISAMKNSTLHAEQITSVLLKGNTFSCDCAIEWLVSEVQQNDSFVIDKKELECVWPNSTELAKLHLIDIRELHCSEVTIVNFTDSAKAKLGNSARFICQAVSFPTAEIIWITPRKRVLEYNSYHSYPYTTSDQSAVMDTESQIGIYHWNTDSSYHSEFEFREDRITILQDGSLFIHYVLTSDTGSYKCIAKNPRNSTSVLTKFTLDYQIINEVKVWSIIVGSICAGSFFLLNLIYSLALAGVRKCVSQRRREQIRHVIESMDQYKTDHLTRIKENYNTQVGRIRDQYHYQLGRLREHHHNKMDRIKEGASQKSERMREIYNNQLGKLKDYSSNQLVQIRDKYNNQILRIKDYGSDKFERIHEKYKLKQQHVIRLLEMMNLDNCKTVFESECVRTESMILQSDILNTDVPLHSPIDSDSVSDSEYLTATNSEASSNENIYEATQINNIPISIPDDFKATAEDDVPMEEFILGTEPELSGNNEIAMNYTVNEYEPSTSAMSAISVQNSQGSDVTGTQEIDDGQPTGVTGETGVNGYRLQVLDPRALDIPHNVTNIRESFV